MKKIPKLTSEQISTILDGPQTTPLVKSGGVIKDKNGKVIWDFSKIRCESSPDVNSPIPFEVMLRPDEEVVWNYSYQNGQKRLLGYTISKKN